VQPFPYQEEALQALAEARRQKKTEALVVMASGLGKTVLAAFDAKAYLEDGGRVLYLCHQNDILLQARKTFQLVLGGSYSFASLHGNNKDLGAIHKATCVFSSFQTMREWQGVFPKGAFDYIIVDEGHHVQAETYKSTLEYFVADFILGITATPDRADLQDIRSIYGHEIYSLPLEEALARGLLTPVRYVLLSPITVDIEELREDSPYLTIKELDQRLFAPQSDPEIVRTIEERSAGVPNARRMIFCPSIEYCDRLSASLPGSAPIHSGLSRSIQDRRLDWFRSGEISTVLTVDKFNEGLDIPEANVIVFLRSTASRTIFLQQLGRGLRRAEGKEEVLALDFVGNCQRLEMVHHLWDGVARVRRHIAHTRKSPTKEATPSFDVDAGMVEFSESTQDIIDVIKTVRSRPKAERKRLELPVYSREELLEMFQKLAAKSGKLPSQWDLTRNGLPPVQVFKDAFGSWEDAIEAAGYCPRGKSYSAQEMINQLRTLKSRLGRRLTKSDLREAARQGRISSFLYNVGSLRTFLRGAGVNPEEFFAPTVRLEPQSPQTPKGTYTKEKLVEDLKALAEEVERVPTQGDIFNANQAGKCASMSTYIYYFGSYRVAVEAAGLPWKRRGRNPAYTKDQLAQQFRDLMNELGRIPTVREMADARDRGKRIATYITFLKYFGSFDAVIEAAKELPDEAEATG
jgi:superfamily II DNA or RNA helicase